MGWENDLNVAGCWLPNQDWSSTIASKGGELSHDVTCAILRSLVLPELQATNITLDGVLSISKSAIDSFHSTINSSSILKWSNRIFLILLCLMAFAAAAA
jgi:hypothetical protein